MDQINILVVDDEKEIADLVEIYLVSDGYKVFKANNALDGLEILEKEEIHLVLLDIMMPGMDGLEMCRKIRETNNIPIIMLSAKSTDLDKILGLGTGADDYVVKPFSPKELMMRVSAILKRSGGGEAQRDVVTYGGLTVDFTGRLVYIDGKRVDMTPKEYDLFFYLVKNKGIALTREKLINEVWGYDFYGDDRTLDTHIKLLRKSLGEYSGTITTLRGVGYRFEGC